jgi:hypothetical protein
MSAPTAESQTGRGHLRTGCIATTITECTARSAVLLPVASPTSRGTTSSGDAGTGTPGSDDEIVVPRSWTSAVPPERAPPPRLAEERG